MLNSVKSETLIKENENKQLLIRNKIMQIQEDATKNMNPNAQIAAK